MITNFKIFEHVNETPQVGDYIVSSINFSTKDWNNYINNNIGKILSLSQSKTPYVIRYNIPEDLIHLYFDNYELDDVKEDKYGVRYIVMKLNRNDIIFYSDKLIECELFLKSKRYNI